MEFEKNSRFLIIDDSQGLNNSSGVEIKKIHYLASEEGEVFLLPMKFRKESYNYLLEGELDCEKFCKSYNYEKETFRTGKCMLKTQNNDKVSGTLKIRYEKTTLEKFLKQCGIENPRKKYEKELKIYCTYRYTNGKYHHKEIIGLDDEAKIVTYLSRNLDGVLEELDKEIKEFIEYKLADKAYALLAMMDSDAEELRDFEEVFTQITKLLCKTKQYPNVKQNYTCVVENLSSKKIRKELAHEIDEIIKNNEEEEILDKIMIYTNNLFNIITKNKLEKNK